MNWGKNIIKKIAAKGSLKIYPILYMIAIMELIDQSEKK
jgi:hypothetical protein